MLPLLAPMWHRGLRDCSSWGNVDLNRMRIGNVGLQVFTMPTHVPVASGHCTKLGNCLAALSTALRKHFDGDAVVDIMGRNACRAIAQSLSGGALDFRQAVALCTRP